MRKIGLLTVHCSTNFGGSLQAYALQTYLESLEKNSVEIINYRYKGFIDVLDYTNKKISLRSWLKLFLFGNVCKERYRRFQQFEKEWLKVGKEIYTHGNELANVDGKYDICVVGSDQVWNPTHIHFDTAFFFEGIRKTKKISYAASIGKELLREDELHFLENVIDNMDCVCVREQKSVELLQNLKKGLTVSCNIDPVFLLKVNQWRALEREVPNIKCPYVLVYVLGENDFCDEIVNEMKKQGRFVVCIQGELTRRCGDINLYGIGPLEFLSLIDNAELVITNSFHGLSFSILFKKNIIGIKSKRLNLRLENLLQLFGAEEIQIDSLDVYADTTWECVWERLKERSDSIIEQETRKARQYFENAF